MTGNDKSPYEEKMEPPTQFYRDRFPKEKLAGKLEEELDAKETKFFQKDGVVIETRDVTAWGVRQKARQDAHELCGDYPARKVESKTDVSGTIFHDLSERLEKAIEATEDAIRGKRSNKSGSQKRTE